MTAMYKLFVYGTLMFAEIFSKVTSDTPSFSNGILKDYHRYRIRSQTGKILPYPAIYPKEGAYVQGLLTNISPEAIRRLDAFEDSEYARKTCNIHFENSMIKAFVYVWAKDPSMLFDEWLPEKFNPSTFM
jgi:gamma-glutamylcyclotransferase (GGCT)/AIG2-like uncharacterized protein YtfP